MTRPFWTIGIFCIALVFPVHAQNVEKKPDPVALASAGQASFKRFQKESASWATTTPLPGGVKVVVEVVASPLSRRWVMSFELEGRREEFARITQKEGVWYVTEGGKAGKYRSFEAPLDIPTAYVFLVRSEPRFITEAGQLGLGTYAGTKNGIATYRSPLPDSQANQLQKTIAELDQFKKQNPGQDVAPEATRTIDAARNLLKSGLSTEVELDTGMLTQYGAPELRTEVTGFRWRGQIEPNEFATDGPKWVDYTDDPTSGERDDLLLIGHSGFWRPGMPAQDTDGRLLNVKTGRYRRIAFRGAITMPGCFTRGRTRVVVTGVNTMTGVMGLYEIDLKTGENRQLGGDLLATGFSLFPSLSPDGKTVAVLHKDASGGILDAQICLVDLATGNAKPLGEPRDTGPLCWFPDGKALVIVDRKSVDVSKPAIGTICRLDLDGRITKLCPGSSPVVLGDGKRILFQDQTSRTWKTCDLVGGDVKLYADGMKGCAFPAPSPDGKRLLMMHFRSGQGPEPLIFPLEHSEGTPATTAPGLWTSPAWR
jgi:hypothetical protein